MLNELGIEKLRAGVLGRAFFDLSSGDPNINEDAHRFFQEGWYRGWTDKDLSRFYKLYLKMMDDGEAKSRGGRRKVHLRPNGQLRQYMREFPKISIKDISRHLGKSYSTIFNWFCKPMKASKEAEMLTIARKIKEEKIRCMKKQGRRSN